MHDDLRLLIVEGNPEALNRQMAAAGLATNGAQYVASVRQFAPRARIAIAHPADPGARLPRGLALRDFDGVILGGSGLHVRARGNVPAVARQVDLVRDVFRAGVPLLGSCWGLQVAAVAARGDVQACARGREVGICRDVVLNGPGRAFPLFDGKARTFSSLAIHYDEVTRLPAGARVLAGNGHSRIQAAEFRWLNGWFFGVQYHPEFDFAHMAGLYRLYADKLPGLKGLPDAAAVTAAARAFDRLHRDPGDRDAARRVGADPSACDVRVRRREIDNWLHFCRLAKSA